MPEIGEQVSIYLKAPGWSYEGRVMDKNGSRYLINSPTHGILWLDTKDSGIYIRAISR